LFSKFNALFVRQIRGAIQERQDKLIESVKQDIKTSEKKFKAFL
jgi:hypothetical protein